MLKMQYFIPQYSKLTDNCRYVNFKNLYGINEDYYENKKLRVCDYYNSISIKSVADTEVVQFLKSLIKKKLKRKLYLLKFVMRKKKKL